MQTIYKLPLFLICTVTYQHGQLFIDTIDFQLFSPHYTPLEPTEESLRLHELLISRKRFFHKPLRFSLLPEKPIADTVLTDMGGDSLPLFFDNQVRVAKEGSDNHLDEIKEDSLPDPIAQEVDEEFVVLPDNAHILIANDYKWRLPEHRTDK